MAAAVLADPHAKVGEGVPGDLLGNAAPGVPGAHLGNGGEEDKGMEHRSAGMNGGEHGAPGADGRWRSVRIEEFLETALEEADGGRHVVKEGQGRQKGREDFVVEGKAGARLANL
jgi:hypothetical protein